MLLCPRTEYCTDAKIRGEGNDETTFRRNYSDALLLPSGAAAALCTRTWFEMVGLVREKNIPKFGRRETGYT